MNQKEYHIVAAGNEYQPMFALSKEAGWNQTANDLSILVARNARFNLLAKLNTPGLKKAVGSGLVTSLDPTVAWIGMILVNTQYRRRGIARALMENCLIAARISGDHPVVGLDATPQGLKVYRHLGFIPSFNYWRCEVPTRKAPGANSCEITPIQFPVTGLPAFLKQTGIEDKNLWLELVHSLFPTGSWMALEEKKIRGLVMTRPGRLKPFVGPLIANSLDTAGCLLNQALDFWQQQGHREVFVDIPERHFQSVAQWEDDHPQLPSGCHLHPEARAKRCLVRMYQLVAHDAFQQLKTSLDLESSKRLTPMLEHANKNRQLTRKYLKQEQKTLDRLFATGGPELS